MLHNPIKAFLFVAVLGGACTAWAGEADDAYQRGVAAQKAQRGQEAEAAFTEAIKLDARHVEAYLARARLYIAREDLEKAIADLDKAIELDPQRARSWFARGQAYVMGNDDTGALRDFAAALKLDPKLAEAYSARAAVYADAGEYAKAVADDTAAIELKPDDPKGYQDRAQSYRELKQHDKALADLTKAAALKPDDAAILGERAVEQLLMSKYAEGIADMRRAIALNKNDAGQNYRPNRDVELSAAAIKHGEQQVEAMLRDRPPMAEYGDEAAFLRKWAARKFAGEDVGETVDWDPQPPTDSDAEHIAPTAENRGRIMVDLNYQQGPQRGKPRTFEELWSRAAFELHNIGLAKQFVRLHDEAQRGKIAKRQFVFEMWQHEEQTMQLSRAFYLNQFLPFVVKQQLKTNPDLWFASHWQAVDDAQLDTIPRTVYPWRPYARQYDWQTFWALYQKGRVRRAMKILEDMRSEEQHPRDLAEVHLWLGRCEHETGESAQAVVSLTECLRLSPNHVEALQLRAAAYSTLGKADEAAADAKKAKRLSGDDG